VIVFDQSLNSTEYGLTQLQNGDKTGFCGLHSILTVRQLDLDISHHMQFELVSAKLFLNESNPLLANLCRWGALQNQLSITVANDKQQS